ncbi:hypothetical protein Fmac_001388 [Flemingia macrophylla]|uniref:Uncharacterized protein n=1 Tax=Flemingia macrophylla TaxID=520843 RepID=A0ABD1NIL4_9FABA
MGGTSSSILVHGFSWLYGSSRGEIELQEIVNAISSNESTIQNAFLKGAYSRVGSNYSLSVISQRKLIFRLDFQTQDLGYHLEQWFPATVCRHQRPLTQPTPSEGPRTKGVNSFTYPPAHQRYGLRPTGQPKEARKEYYNCVAFDDYTVSDNQKWIPPGPTMIIFCALSKTKSIFRALSRMMSSFLKDLSRTCGEWMFIEPLQTLG